MNGNIKTIPYGISDFGTLRRLNGYYVDNTWGLAVVFHGDELLLAE